MRFGNLFLAISLAGATLAMPVNPRVAEATSQLDQEGALAKRFSEAASQLDQEGSLAKRFTEAASQLDQEGSLARKL